jgi:class 3 adenylate cyclase
MPLAHAEEGGDALTSETPLVVAPDRRQRPSTLPRPDVAAHSSPRPTSAIHGFLFADLRGFTHYTDEHGDAAGAELLQRFRVVVRTAASASDGAEIRTEGDSFYIVFGTASAAVRCGLDITEAAAAASDVDVIIDVGVGVHAGEAVETEEGPVGSAVNIAERLCELAGPGDVVVSEIVRYLAHGTEAVSFEPLGNRALRGLDEPVATFLAHDKVPAAGLGPPATGWGARGRWRSGAIGAAALLAFGAVGAILWQDMLPFGTQAATPSPVAPSPAATANAVPSATDDQGWRAAEAALLQRIPLEFQDYCRPSGVEDGAAGGTARLRCDLRDAPGYGADTVWYDAFDDSTRGKMAVVMTETATEQNTRTIDGGRAAVIRACTEHAGGAIGRWELGSSLAGQLACYARDGEAWLAWTYEGQDILARAVRLDGDFGHLVEWWDERAADYLR